MIAIVITPRHPVFFVMMMTIVAGVIIATEATILVPVIIVYLVTQHPSPFRPQLRRWARGPVAARHVGPEALADPPEGKVPQRRWPQPFLLWEGGGSGSRSSPW